MDTLKLILLSHQGDKEAREQILKENMGLVWSIVKRFLNRGYDGEELFQIGCIGLMKAIDKFDLNYHVMFSTYAVPMITGEIKRFLRDDGMIKVSRSLKETGIKAARIREEMTKEFHREPTLQEIAKRMEISCEDLVTAMDAQSEVESLQKTIFEGEGNKISLMERIEEGGDEHNAVLNRILVQELLGQLNPKEQKIIKLRYFLEKTQTEIANELGISQVQVSRLEKKILREMRNKLGE